MWINPATITGDSVVLGKFWNAGMTSPYYQYAIELVGGRPVLFIGTATGLVGASMDSSLAVNQWSHLAVVFNGSQAQFYVNGSLAGTKPLTATMTARGQLMRVGADASPSQFYRGALDNLRIYNRTLTASELQSDMNTAVGAGAPPDTTPPSTPSGLTATAAGATQINLSWTASTDNVGVTGYRVERCAGATCTTFTQVGTPTATTFNNTGLTPSTTYRYQVRAVDQAAT